tara:strand:+ start:4434 stop:4778 length:345 start_codon:yes stop_codon:yes gene_type:complete
MSNFENNIKNWVNIDNQIKSLNEKARELREQRNELCEEILTYAGSNNLGNATVSISDGRLKFATSKSTAPLTLRFVQKCLEDVISDQESVGKIMKYIKSKREVRTSSDIKRYYN